jgi:hypothetical protein
MPDERERYRPSGRFDPVRMAVWFVAFSPLALVGGYVTCQGDRWLGPLGVVAACVGGLFAAGTAAAAVRFGKCRSRLVGGLAGVLAGAVCDLSSYQFDFAHEFGFAHVLRLDALPHYLDLKLRNHFDTAAALAFVPADDPDPGSAVARGADAARQQLGPVPPVSWARLLGYLAAACAVPVIAGVVTAGVPFAEPQRRWLYGQQFFLDPEAAHDLAFALEDGGPDDLADAAEPTEFRVWADVGVLTVYYLPYVTDSSVYAHLQVRNGAAALNNLPTKLLRYAKLTEAEAVVLKRRLKLPGLAVGEPPVVARRTQAKAGEGAVIDLPGGGTVLTRATAWKGNLIAASPLIAGLAVAAAAGVAAWLAFAEFGWAGVAAPATIGVAALVGGVAATVFCEAGLGGRYMHRKLTAAVRARPDPAVDPDDPEAVPVQVIPRAHWGRVMLENATDAGFLKLDPARRLILFEGDRQRWRIPAAAVTALRVEEFVIGPMDPHESNVHPMLVLTATVDGEPWEAPLCRPHLSLTRWTTATRRRAVAELEAMLRPFVAAGNSST